MKAVSRLFLLIIMPISVHASDFCIQSVGVDIAYKSDIDTAATKEEKAYFKKLLKEEKSLLESLLEQISPTLETDRRYKNSIGVVKQACWVINHDPRYTNVLLAYSSEIDDYFRPRDQVLFSKKNPESTIRLNVTEKLIKLLAFARQQRGDLDQIQPAVVGYAGSYLVRDAWIAANYIKTPMRDLRNGLKAGKNVVAEEVMKIVNDQKMKVGFEREAIELQQEFAQTYLDDGLLDWAAKTSISHPDFFHEKLLFFRDGKFIEYDSAWFDGQYRVGEIVRDLFVTRSAYSKDLPEETLQNGKSKLKDLQSEWARYINDSPESKEILQEFVMENVLSPFIERYNQEVSRIPDFLK